jgi:hypothetical protein
MWSNSWCFTLAIVALSTMAFGQQQATTDEISPLATTTCQSTFTFGSGESEFDFCITANGNLAQLTSPAGWEHIRNGTIGEGYGICEELSNSLSGYYDYAGGGDSGNWDPPAITQPHGPSTFPLKITRTTSDGIFTLTQTFTRDTKEREVLIKMTLKNNTSSTRNNVVITRWADINASNDLNNNFDKASEAAWGHTRYGVLLATQSTLPTILMHTGFIQNNPNKPGTCDVTGFGDAAPPFSGDGSAGLRYLMITGLGPHKTQTITIEYKRF